MENETENINIFSTKHQNNGKINLMKVYRDIAEIGWQRYFVLQR